MSENCAMSAFSTSYFLTNARPSYQFSRDWYIDDGELVYVPLCLTDAETFSKFTDEHEQRQPSLVPTNDNNELPFQGSKAQNDNVNIKEAPSSCYSSIKHVPNIGVQSQTLYFHDAFKNVMYLELHHFIIQNAQEITREQPDHNTDNEEDEEDDFLLTIGSGLGITFEERHYNCIIQNAWCQCTNRNTLMNRSSSAGGIMSLDQIMNRCCLCDRESLQGITDLNSFDERIVRSSRYIDGLELDNGLTVRCLWQSFLVDRQLSEEEEADLVFCDIQTDRLYYLEDFVSPAFTAVDNGDDVIFKVGLHVK